MYNAIDLEQANNIKEEMINRFEETAPKAVEKLDNGFNDVMAVM